MKIIEPSVELLWITPNAIKEIEKAGRVCYKSEGKIADGSAENFVAKLIARGHEAMIEHAVASLKFTCDRGVTHEMVRHRIPSFAQESTRYCNYSKDQFDNQLTMIKPCFWKDGDILNDDPFTVNADAGKLAIWMQCLEQCEKAYNSLIQLGATPQEARSVLPNSLKTEIVVTCNFREWRHVFKLRTSNFAHPQIKEVMLMALDILKKEAPVIFNDL